MCEGVPPFFQPDKSHKDFLTKQECKSEFVVGKCNLTRLKLLKRVTLTYIQSFQGLLHIFVAFCVFNEFLSLFFSVLYFSIHRYDNAQFFPFSTSANYDVVGCGPGKGYTVNVPWNKVSTNVFYKPPNEYKNVLNSIGTINMLSQWKHFHKTITSQIWEVHLICLQLFQIILTGQLEVLSKLEKCKVISCKVLQLDC